jgi:leucyl-tRNA synthetase
MIPHVCEEINEKLGSQEFCSLREIPKLEVSDEAADLMLQTDFVKTLTEDIQAIIDLKRESPKKIIIYVAPGWKQELYTEVSQILGGGSFNMGKVMGTLKSNPKFTPKMKNIAKELKFVRGDAKVFRKEFVGTDKELNAISGYKPYLSQHFESEIEVFEAETESINDPMKKASKAQPMKPALYIEF